LPVVGGTVFAERLPKSAPRFQLNFYRINRPPATEVKSTFQAFVQRPSRKIINRFV
jgi:hypothetical protein